MDDRKASIFSLIEFDNIQSFGAILDKTEALIYFDTNKFKSVDKNKKIKHFATGKEAHLNMEEHADGQKIRNLRFEIYQSTVCLHFKKN